MNEEINYKKADLYEVIKSIKKLKPEGAKLVGLGEIEYKVNEGVVKLEFIKTKVSFLGSLDEEIKKELKERIGN